MTNKMKKVYATQSTEYEFGQRPDGFYLSVNLDVLNKFIKEVGNSGSADCYWRCSAPVEIVIDSDEDYAKILEATVKGHNVGWFKELPPSTYKKVS